LAEKGGKKSQAYLDADKEFSAANEEFIKSRNMLEAERRAQGITHDQLYERARGKTPNTAMDNLANSKGNVDPVYGHVVSGRLSPDHIVPVVDIVRIPGYEKLPPKMQSEVLNLAENTMGMDPAVNLSKGDRLWSAAPGSPRYWKGYQGREIPDIVRRQMAQRETRAQAAVIEAIEQRLKKLGLK
jgi:hypothetical protein